MRPRARAPSTFLNGLYDAKLDGAPVLALTGMTYHDLIGTRYQQDVNTDYLFADVAAFNQQREVQLSHEGTASF